MKIYARRSIQFDPDISVEDILNNIISVTLVSDINDYSARHLHIFANESKNSKYAWMTREELLNLPEKERAKIHDISILRKLRKSELTPQQQMEVYKANSDNFVCKISDVKSILAKLKNCDSFHISDTDKNKSFSNKIWQLGGRLRDDDAWDIVQELHVSDYSYSTYSYLDRNWNSLLVVFEYKGEHTFRARDKRSEGVTVTNMDVYIKIDIESETHDGYAIMSFHEPEFKMSHPYKDYPIEKE